MRFCPSLSIAQQRLSNLFSVISIFYTMNIAAELVLFRPFSGKERKPRSVVKCFFFFSEKNAGND